MPNHRDAKKGRSNTLRKSFCICNKEVNVWGHTVTSHVSAGMYLSIPYDKWKVTGSCFQKSVQNAVFKREDALVGRIQNKNEYGLWP